MNDCHVKRFDYFDYKCAVHVDFHQDIILNHYIFYNANIFISQLFLTESERNFAVVVDHQILPRVWARMSIKLSAIILMKILFRF